MNKIRGSLLNSGLMRFTIPIPQQHTDYMSVPRIVTLGIAECVLWETLQKNLIFLSLFRPNDIHISKV